MKITSFMNNARTRKSMQTTVTTQSTLFPLCVSNVSVKCIMLETKHEEAQLCCDFDYEMNLVVIVLSQPL